MAATYPVSIAEMCERYKKLYTGAIGNVLDNVNPEIEFYLITSTPSVMT